MQNQNLVKMSRGPSRIPEYQNKNFQICIIYQNLYREIAMQKLIILVTVENGSHTKQVD